MNKLSQIGSEVLNHKIEFNKDYPEIIKNALIEAIKAKVPKGDFEKIKDYLVSTDVNVDEFRLTLFSIGAPFCKTTEELLVEFDIIIKEMMNEFGWTDVSTKIDMEKERFVFVKPYLLPENFARDYFGVPDKNVFKLMAKDGLIGRFAGLRLPAIFKNILKEIDYNGDLYSFDTSPAYYHEDLNTYGIDLLLSFNIEDVIELRNENALSGVITEVHGIENVITKEYALRLLP